MNKIRRGEVKIYKGKEYIAIPEIEEESCTGCCFYDKGICSIDHANDPNCLHSGMIWEQKENGMSDIKEKAIKLAIEAMKPIPVYSSPCYSINDSRSPEEKHEEEMRFCREFNDLKCEMLIDMAKKNRGIFIIRYGDYIQPCTKWYIITYQLSSPVKVPISVLTGLVLIPTS